MTAPADAAHHEGRPMLAPLITVEEPLADGGSWIIARDGIPLARVSPPVARAATQFTGMRTVDQIAVVLGDPWTPSDVGQVVSRLGEAGLLRDTVHSKARPGRWSASRQGRIRFIPPLTLQWSFGDPSRVFAAASSVTRVVMGAPGAVAGAVVVFAGIAVAASTADDTARVLARPIDLAVLLMLGAALVLTTVLHEIGHGAALSNFGGSPRRIGVMLFYLAPAFFCDVTDGWRLSRRWQRVVVSLAGPGVHLVCAAAGILVSRVAADPAAHSALVLYSLACTLIAVFNLVPFVQLDGYLALMSALDRPHLRADAIAAADRALAVAAFGARRVRRTPVSGWIVAFGIACRIFPLLIVAAVLYRFATGVASAGGGATVAYFATLLLVFAVAVRWLVKSLRTLVAAKPDGRRVAAFSLVAALGLALALAAVPVRATQNVGFIADGGAVTVVASSSAALPEPGARVTLESNGVLFHRVLGQAVVRGESRSVDVDLAALIPVSATGLETPVYAVAVVQESAAPRPLPEFGRATYPDLTTPTVAAWLWQTFIARPVGALWKEGAQ